MQTQHSCHQRYIAIDTSGLQDFQLKRARKVNFGRPLPQNAEALLCPVHSEVFLKHGKNAL